MKFARTCIVCDSQKATVIREKLRYDVGRNVLRCNHCGFVYLERVTTKKPYYAGKKYRDLYKPVLNKKSSAALTFNTYFPYQKEIIKKLQPILRRDMKVLDVGCSTGHFLAALKGKVGKRVGLELSQDETNFIKKNLDFKVYTEPIERAKITEGPFDLITSLQVVEHLEDPVSVLKSAARLLKPKGWLYMEMPNINDVLLSTYRVPGYEDFYFREPHLSYFSKDTLARLMKKAGFKGVIQTVQRYNLPNHLHWIMTGQPMPSFVDGNSAPVLVKADNINSKIKNDLNRFIQKADADYKQLLEKHGLGECLTFLGHKI